MSTHLTPEMQAAIQRLNELPAREQAHVAPRINDYLTRLEALREAIREGEESGPAEALDMNAMARESRDSWEAARG